ncbi:hypothetical protein RHGRI_035068 [Rhododendron griersonianum]|uniref:Bidirectional sugar transporter SWEET n=1 Tax=Rhododendron griersonianum TaxID=479676 RepID=A0AAV6I3J2_9ERIC|nr:hypothetical protein RHGRI_035068 [Rhododendron griersonianum]
MGGFSSHNLAFAFGLLGNIISFFVFLSPLPTFYKIYQKKSTEGFQSVPYVVALFSAMLLMYYAFLKDNDGILIITINSFGCLVETIYIAVYLFYAPKKTKKQVIRTQSVEYMPFSLSLSLTLNAVMWFFYGLLIKDFNVAIPNVLGFVFGIIQMVLYEIYKRKGTKKLALAVEGQKIMAAIDAHQMLEKQVIADQVMIDVAKLSEMVDVCPETVPLVPCAANELDDHIAAELVLAKAN